MAFEYPSVATEKKLANKKTKEAKEKKQQEDFGKAVSPVSNKKGLKGDIAQNQLDAAFSIKNIGDGGKIFKKDKTIDFKKLKKVVKAAADDKQLERTERSLMRHKYKGGGGVKKNSKRMNKLEELGRVDSEKAYSSKGKKNLKAEKTRIVKSLNSRGAAKRGHGAEIK